MPIFWVVILVILAGALVYMVVVEPRRLKLKSLSVAMPGLTEPVKLLFISDFHANVGQTERLIARMEALPKSAWPKLIVLGGDYLHRGQGLDKVEQILTLLQRLDLPIVAVLGNHDISGGQEVEGKLFGLLKTHQVQLLKNEAIIFTIPGQKQTLQIIGADELERDSAYANRQNFKRSDHFKELASQLPWFKKIADAGLPRLLISHNPDGIYLPLAGPAPTLVLSGHTHGGQVFWNQWLPDGFWKLTRYQFDPTGSFRVFAGLKVIGSQTHLIGRGLGGYPLRCGRVPEAHLIELRT